MNPIVSTPHILPPHAHAAHVAKESDPDGHKELGQRAMGTRSLESGDGKRTNFYICLLHVPIAGYHVLPQARR